MPRSSEVQWGKRPFLPRRQSLKVRNSRPCQRSDRTWARNDKSSIDWQICHQFHCKTVHSSACIDAISPESNIRESNSQRGTGNSQTKDLRNQWQDFLTELSAEAWWFEPAISQVDHCEQGCSQDELIDDLAKSQWRRIQGQNTWHIPRLWTWYDESWSW